MMKKMVKEDDMNKIQFLLKKGLNMKDVAEATGFSIDTIRRIKNGTHYLCVKHTEEVKEEVPEAAPVTDAVPVPIPDMDATVVHKLDTIIDKLNEILEIWNS